MKISQKLILAAMIVAAGCDSDGILRPPPTEVNVFNAAANVERVDFLREGVVEASMAYGEGLEASFDSGPYDFHVERFSLADSRVIRTFSANQNVAADSDYVFVVTAPAGVPEFFVATRADDPASDDSARITLVHGFVGLGPLDVYLEPSGTDLTTVLPRGRVDYGPTGLSVELLPGAYSIFLTAPDDPTDIVFESFDQSLSLSTDDFFVISDPGLQGTLNILVSRISATTGRIGQVGQGSELRVIQGVDDRLDRDIYIDTTAVAPLFPAQPFGVLSPYMDVTVAQHMVITTPAGNPGTEEASIGYFAIPGRTATAVIAGDTTDGVSTHMVVEDNRSIAGQATVRIYNAAGQFDSSAIYIEEPGTDVTTVNPLVNIFPPQSQQRIPLLPGDYEITIENLATSTILAGPLAVTMNDGGVYGILLINGPDANTVDIVLFDDFVP